jgi:hypothetical protein
MSWTRRRFEAAIDRHVQGIYHSQAPWNIDDSLPPMCEDCDVDDCGTPCDKLEQYMAEENEKMRQMEEAEYEFYLKEQIIEILKCHSDGITLDAIVEISGKPKSDVTSALGDLEEKGLTVHVWQLTDDDSQHYPDPMD